MRRVLVYLATGGGRVRRASLEVLSACRTKAAALGWGVDALVIDPDPARYVDDIAAFGPDRVFTICDPIFSNHLNRPLTAALAAGMAASQASVLAAASTEAVKDVLGALAVRLDAAALPDVASFDLAADGVTALRPVMAAKQLARTQAKGDCVLISVRSGAYDAIPSASTPAVEAIPFVFEEADLTATLREVVASTGDTVDLSEARVVVAAGRGVRDEAGRDLVQSLASVLGGAIGASRAVVESGLFPATAQIGQTGKVVAPELYFAVGISGAIQHVAGMANSKVIVAINKDPDAPIFQYATYGLAGDLYKILPPLVEQLRAARAGT